MKLVTCKDLRWTDGENERVASFICTIYSFYLYLPTISPIEQFYASSSRPRTSNLEKLNLPWFCTAIPL